MDLFELRYSDYSLADEQAAVRDAFREFLAMQCPATRVRAAEPLGYDTAIAAFPGGPGELPAFHPGSKVLVPSAKRKQ